MTRVENLLGAQALALADRLLSGDGAPGGPTSEAAALVTLLAHPGHPVGWLGEVLGLTSSGVTRLTDRLVVAGLVERGSGPDARRRPVELTAQGRDRAERILDGRRTVLARALGVLSEAERSTLEGLLGKVVAGLTTDRLPALRICRLCDRAACDGRPHDDRPSAEHGPHDEHGPDDDRPAGSARACPLWHTVR